MIAEHLRDTKDAISRSLYKGLFLLLAGVAGIAAMGMAAVALFITVAARFDAVIASLAVAGACVLAAIALVVAAIYSGQQRPKPVVARLAGAAVSWLEPSILAAGFDVARMIGGRRATTLAAGAVAAYLVMTRVGGSQASSVPPDNRPD
jgi:hypothetical protein